ncbi:MAG TPA: hypothetical protein DHN33_04980 [Eubacteriaceae bacterium]|nr:hypothetical protein [Eubacteriaceae bacterium]
MKKIRSWAIVGLFVILMTALIFSGCSSETDGGDDGAGQADQIGESMEEAQEGPEEVIAFAEPVFERLIKEALEKEEIFPSDLSEYTGLNIVGDEMIVLSSPDLPEESVILMGEDGFEYKEERYTGYGTMKTFEDLKHFPSLSNLKITLQPEADFTTIPENDQITVLSLSQSHLTEVEFLDRFSGLMFLTIYVNDIVSLDGMEELTNLKQVQASSNEISDVTALSELVNLTRVDLSINKVENLEPFVKLTNLEQLWLYDNNITDISPLEGLSGSLKDLVLSHNAIKDVSPLKEYTEMERLDLSGNPVENREDIEHIENATY